MAPYADGYLTDPIWRDVVVTGDTTGGLGFTLNRAHCYITGTLVNIPTPLSSSEIYVSARTGAGNLGYQAGVTVDSVTGTYEMWLCDGDWTFEVPFFDDFVITTIPTPTIGEFPDTARTIDLVYTFVSDVDDENGNTIPSELALRQNYPNPFNPETVISFDLPARGQVDVTVYNLLGQQIVTLLQDNLEPGTHTVTWDGTDVSGKSVPSGIYFYRLQANQFSETRKMILLK
jgi:hypothetical protein